MSDLHKFVVVMREPGDHVHIFVMFFDAEDHDHAKEQAENAEPNSPVMRVVQVPS